MTPRSILFVIAHPPHRGALAFEVLDELLVGAAFEQRVSVLFIDEGVFQLIDGGKTEDNVARGYRALPTYEVSHVYVDGGALRRRGLSAESLAIPARIVARAGIRKLISTHDVVVPD